ncbi:ATPase family AAA domain-containing protein FIGL1 [Impatiens glandulifera]|uniref:ATPase family AAA domain-containing protein FIGL1 n=1 Tax=Impatiens glandulifera TaxID=253017 RepID=UPI001FB1747A|nr:ATPase family AAA domain-containing protein FIGL1 [Impatiens glandulifera]
MGVEMKMAGKKKAGEVPATEGASEVCWRKEVDNNINRLQSLLFGADLAFQKGDFFSAQVLALQLVGFLDSHTLSDVDNAFIQPIRREALSKIDAARQSIAAESDRLAFEQAGVDSGCIFSKKGKIDMCRIKESKFFQALVQKTEEPSKESGGQLDRQDKQSCKTSKVMTQAKLPFLYRNNTATAERSTNGETSMNNRSISEVSSILERVDSLQDTIDNHGGSRFPKLEENRIHGNGFRTKRTHKEINSPRVDGIKSPSCNEDADTDTDGAANGFVTARTKLEMEARQQRRGMSGSPCASVSPRNDNNRGGYGAKSYGFARRGVRGNFVPPVRSNGNNTGGVASRGAGKSDDTLEDSTRRCLEMLYGPDGELPEKLRNLEPRLIEHISNEIMNRDPLVRWDDIAGLEHAKKCVTEMVIWPLLRPDIFKGCRTPGRGLLLFGPPGTGKTLIGKAIAGEAKATFFYISASSLTSKWIGEGEKLVRALFGVASCRQPAVIFIDEIDSLLSQRKSEGEHESSRRLKTQFLIEMEGFDNGNEQVLLIGATNRPQELDEAARRRLTKRLYIPLPSSDARAWIVRHLLQKDELFKLSEEDMECICKLTEGYSGSDMKNLVMDASMGPLRDALRQGIEITNLKKEDLRTVIVEDFKNALQEVRPSVSCNELGTYEEWNKQFGSLSV